MEPAVVAAKAAIIMSEEMAAAAAVTGSLLLRRTAWIRIQSERGEVFAELLRGKCRRSVNWRRLHVIWRHIGAAPGSC